MQLAGEDQPDRIIPAYAGSTTPHAICFSRSFGSSPHTRGALYSTIDRWDDRGIIPAYAGSTRLDPDRSGVGEDHPRIRGEHLWNGGMKLALTTDHPRIRGEHSHFISYHE